MTNERGTCNVIFSLAFNSKIFYKALAQLPVFYFLMKPAGVKIKHS